jgi:ankyrin repeat protein
VLIHGRTGTVKVVVDNGANINASNKRGDTPLHISMQVAQVLLRC